MGLFVGFIFFCVLRSMKLFSSDFYPAEPPSSSNPSTSGPEVKRIKQHTDRPAAAAAAAGVSTLLVL